MTTSAATLTRKAPPRVPGLPLLGNALGLRIDPLKYFTELHQAYGPVFEISILGRPYWVMAGIEANQFLAREGEEHLGSEYLFGGFAGELGSDALLVALDGEPHRHQRKVQQRGYSRGTILNQLDLVVDIARGYTAQWQPGQSLPIFPTMQRVVVDQLGMMIGGRVCGEYFDDLWTLLNTNMKVHILKTHPTFFLKLPGYKRAQSRALSFAGEMLEWHRANPPQGREPNLVDDLLAALDEKGQPYSDAMIRASIAGAYFAGMDTVASSTSFLLYAVLKTPGLRERLTEEIDAAFAEGGLTAQSLRGMSLLHDTAIEALRMYPVAPFTPRTVTQPFDFAGYRFETGTQVFVANGVTHYLPEYYPDPLVFDPDRSRRADQPKSAQTFTPFTLGAHTCLGAGMAEVQMMALIAVLLRELELELDPPGADLTVYANPIPNPGRSLAVRVLRQRQRH